MSQMLLLILAIFLVSTAGLFAHRALFEAAPLAIAAWRLGLAALFFLGWRVLDRREHSAAPIGKRVWVKLVLAGLCLAVHFLLWFTSLQYTQVARGTLLVCTTPLWTTLGSILVRRTAISPIYWLALTIAGGGVFLVTQTGVPQVQAHFALLGDMLALLGGFVFAIYLLLVEGLHQVISSRRQVTIAYTVAAVILWASLLTNGGATLHYSLGVWSAIAGLAIGPQILGHTLLNASLRHFPASIVSFSVLLQPVIAAILAYVLLHQILMPGQIFGGFLVLAGVGLVIARQSPAKQRQEEAVE